MFQFYYLRCDSFLYQTHHILFSDYNINQNNLCIYVYIYIIIVSINIIEYNNNLASFDIIFT